MGEAASSAAGSGKALADRIRTEVAKVVVGQEAMIDRLLIALLADGHVLLEGVPGLAKTLAVSTLSSAIKTRFRRIQFTPDLLPADLTGTLVFNQKSGEFTPKFGPIFANLILADEINRAPAKVQSALLEAMQERTVSLGEKTYKLESLFLVLATQNPIEQEGTYPLPEAQMDRFMLMVKVGYPTRLEEERIMQRMTAPGDPPTAEPVVAPEEILEARARVRHVALDQDSVGRYLLDIVFATRDPDKAGLSDLVPYIRLGASPRASIYLNLAARARAFLQGRDYTETDDVKAIARDVLRHRILLTYEAEAEGIDTDEVIRRILARIDETVLWRQG